MSVNVEASMIRPRPLWTSVSSAWQPRAVLPISKMNLHNSLHLHFWRQIQTLTLPPMATFSFLIGMLSNILLGNPKVSNDFLVETTQKLKLLLRYCDKCDKCLKKKKSVDVPHCKIKCQKKKCQKILKTLCKLKYILVSEE